ncbi:uroporphyrinogen-III synthase [Glaesserella sp.]|uniref:uroporphyrinogen-III synthase n=1 Tax=Glaesserella sp. TaxID=2094731 RepID=UPI0035A0B424
MNVLVTRPDIRGKNLVEMLAERHIFAIHQPLFTIEAGRELLQLPSYLSRLNVGDYVFAVSKNAIDFADEALKQTGFSWRSDVNYFAIGQASANYFSSTIEYSVRYPIQSENSEGLLELPEMHHLSGKNIVILRADSGRELFSEQAIIRGANVQPIECYQRIMVDNDLSEKISLSKRAGVDTIVITSGDILKILVEQVADNDREWLMQCRLVVVGQRIARLAKTLKWNADKIRISEKADNHSLLEALLSHREF